MWMFLMIVCLLDQNQAAPLPWQQHSSLQLILQEQQELTTPPPFPDPDPQRTSSSSSSSSSVSSESSQSSEGHQQLRERQRLENMAVEQVDSSQESSALLQSPSNSSSLWLSELVLLGERAGERDRERDTGDNSVESRESRHRALMLTFHHLLTRTGLGGPGLTAGEASAGLGGASKEGGGAIMEVGGVVDEVGVAAGNVGVDKREEIDPEFPRLLDDSTERADGLTLDSPGHAHHHDYHGNEAGVELELGL